MLKAGLISGAIMFVIVLLGASLISPLCALCAPVVTGLLAGYLTGIFEKPEASRANQRGAQAGAIAGALAIPAGLLAAVINAMVMQDPNNQIVNELLGMPPSQPAEVWIGQLGINICVGALNVGLTALLGMGGIAIWSSMSARPESSTPSPAP